MNASGCARSEAAQRGTQAESDVTLPSSVVACKHSVALQRYPRSCDDGLDSDRLSSASIRGRSSTVEEPSPPPRRLPIRERLRGILSRFPTFVSLLVAVSPACCSRCLRPLLVGVGFFRSREFFSRVDGHAALLGVCHGFCGVRDHLFTGRP
jgi:hypothetical protein